MNRQRRARRSTRSTFCSTRRIAIRSAAGDLAERRAEPLHDRGLNALGRLVEQKEARATDQRTRDRELLLLAARHGAGLLPAPLSQDRKPLVHAIGNARRQAGLAEHAEQQVLLDREVGKDFAALRHVGDAEIADLERLQPDQFTLEKPDPAGRDRNVAHDRPEQRRLAHAVSAQQRDRLALAQIERQAAQYLAARVIAGDQSVDRQHKAA